MHQRAWQEDLVDAMTSIGGAGSLTDIYEAIKKIRSPLCPKWKSTARCKLQQFSSDSRWWQRNSSHQRRADLFENPKSGYWKLRQTNRISTEANDNTQQEIAELKQQITGLTQNLQNLAAHVRRVETRLRGLRVLMFTAPPSRKRR